MHGVQLLAAALERVILHRDHALAERMASSRREVILYVSSPCRFACSCFAEMARGNLSRNFFMAGDKPPSSLSNALVMSFRNAGRREAFNQRAG